MAEGLSLQNGKEEVIACRASNKADTRFDQTVGCIQDVLLDEGFNMMLREFLEKYYYHFENTEENKFIYTDIFKQYTELVETYLNEALKLKIPDFVMEKFLETLKSRKDEVGEEIMDMLLSFSDFLTFKQTFLDYKAEKEGLSLHLGGLVVNSLAPAKGGCGRLL